MIGVAFDNAMIGVYNVPFGVQERFPVPSVSNTYPIAPPLIFKYSTLPKSNLKLALPDIISTLG